MAAVTARLVVDMAEFHQAIASAEAELLRLEKLKRVGDPLPGVTAAAVAGLLLAGSPRAVSRRSLLGLGWLRRAK
jgi:hypothetical protein